MAARTEQVLGVTALAVVDRLRTSAAVGAVGGEVAASALVHIQAWPGESVQGLASVVGLSQPATVRLVDRLVAQGLAQREQGRDRRTVALTLTASGSASADAVLAARAEALTPLLAGLSPAERRDLERLLDRVTAGLAQDRSGAVRTCRLCDRDACASGPGCPLDHTTRRRSAPPAVDRRS